MSRRRQLFASWALAALTVLMFANPAAAGLTTSPITLTPNPVEAGSSTTASGFCRGYSTIRLSLSVSLSDGTTLSINPPPADLLTEGSTYAVQLAIPANAIAQTVTVAGICRASENPDLAVFGSLTITALPASTTTTTTTTTTIAPATTTTVAATTTPAPSTTAAATSPTLPATGSNSYSAQAAVIGISALVFGCGLTFLARRRHAAGS